MSREYCCDKLEWLQGHDYCFDELANENSFTHYDSEEFFCCHIKFNYCPFCGSKLK